MPDLSITEHVYSQIKALSLGEKAIHWSQKTCCRILTNGHGNELIPHPSLSPHLASLTWTSTYSTFHGLVVAITHKNLAVPHKLCAMLLIQQLQSVRHRCKPGSAYMYQNMAELCFQMCPNGEAVIVGFQFLLLDHVAIHNLKEIVMIKGSQSCTAMCTQCACQTCMYRINIKPFMHCARCLSVYSTCRYNAKLLHAPTASACMDTAMIKNAFASQMQHSECTTQIEPPARSSGA